MAGDPDPERLDLERPAPERLGPVRFRPRRIRVVACAAAVVVVAASVALAAALSGPVDHGTIVFGTADRVALVGLGLIGAAVMLSLTRPLVEADDQGIRVRNVVGGCQVPWQVVRAIRYERGASWATLELHDDEQVGILAVQAVDKEHAVAAVRALRARLAASER